MQKCSTGTDSDGHSDGDSYGQFLWKLLKFHLIGTDISAKMGTLPIGIGIRRCIGISLGSVETLLHTTIEPIFICIGIGIRIGIGVGQWKHTIRCKVFMNFHKFRLDSQILGYFGSFIHVSPKLSNIEHFVFYKSTKWCWQILNNWIWAKNDTENVKSKNSWIYTRSLKIHTPMKTPTLNIHTKTPCILHLTLLTSCTLVLIYILGILNYKFHPITVLYIKHTL